MKKFTFYLKEAEEPIVESSLKDDLMDMIKRSLNTRDIKTVNDFIAAYKQDSDKNQIEGLINKSDVYDFYLKYQDEVDKILSDNDFYKKSPEEMSIFSLYEYVVTGTKEAVNYIINGLGAVDNKTDF